MIYRLTLTDCEGVEIFDLDVPRSVAVLVAEQLAPDAVKKIATDPREENS